MKEYETQHLRENEHYTNEKMKEKCEKIASKVHHLVSTKCIPGIFSSGVGEEKKIMGIEANTFLRQTFQKKFRI